jgi:hypothetical protein
MVLLFSRCCVEESPGIARQFHSSSLLLHSIIFAIVFRGPPTSPFLFYYNFTSDLHTAFFVYIVGWGSAPRSELAYLIWTALAALFALPHVFEFCSRGS